MDNEHENEELLELEDIDDSDDALIHLGDAVDAVLNIVTDDAELPDDAKADIIQMLEEIQQYVDDARNVISDLPESA